MLFDTIKIGDRVEIQLNKDADSPVTHVSQVDNVLEDMRVILHVPISYGKLVELTMGGEYRLTFFTEKGIARFIGKVDSRMKDGNFEVMGVKLYGGGEKIQRRDFFRFSHVLPVEFAPMDSSTLSPVDKDKVYSAITKDIGGGGVCFLSNELVEEKVIIKINMKLGADMLTVIGEVIQRSYFPKSNYRYQYRVGFVGIRASEQEKIVQFIFNEQKKVLQKVKLDRNSK